MPRYTLFSDDFTRANGTLGAGNWDGSYTGLGTPRIVSNHVEVNALGEDELATINSVAFPADQWAEFTWTWGPDGDGLLFPAPQIALRMSNPVTPVTGYVIVPVKGISTGTPVGTVIYRMDAFDTAVAIAVESRTIWATGDVVSGEAKGSTIAAYRNGVKVLTAKDTTYASGRVGLWIYTAGTLATADNQVDNFNAGYLRRWILRRS